MLSVGICIHAFRINIGSIASPAQGSLPFVAGACLGGLSLRFLLRSLKAGGKSDPRDDFKGDDLKGIKLARILPALGVLVTYSFILSFVGFTTATFLFFVFFFWTMAKLAWWKVLLSSAAVSVISHLFFVVWLKCQLPPGFVGF